MTSISQHVNTIIRNAKFPRRNVSTDVGRAIEHIQILIDRGFLRGGQKLVETEIATQIGVGRGRIREALRILAGEGVLELVENRGARVREHSARELTWGSELGAAVIQAGVRIFLREYDRLEPIAFQSLKAAFKRIGNDTDDLAAVLAKTTDYFLVVNYYSGNRYLNRALGRIYSPYHAMEIQVRLQGADTAKILAAHKTAHDLLLVGDDGALPACLHFHDLIIDGLRGSGEECE